MNLGSVDLSILWPALVAGLLVTATHDFAAAGNRSRRAKPHACRSPRRAKARV